MRISLGWRQEGPLLRHGRPREENELGRRHLGKQQEEGHLHLG